MTMKPVYQGLLALSLAVVFQAAGSIPAPACAPVLKDGWVRLPPAAVPMMAGFGNLQNACPAPVVVVSASSPAFADVSIHETTDVQGVSRMREVESLRLVTGEAATFKPGGLHLMLMRPHAPLHEGDKVVVNFHLEDGRQIQSSLVVRKPAP